MIVVMPMAGRGSRFRDNRADLPKPLVPVAGLPMFVRALASLGGNSDCRVVFVALREHDEQFDIRQMIDTYVQNPADLVLIDDVTAGQLCTVLAARELLPNDEDLLIMSSDTVVVSDICGDIQRKRDDCQGLISTCELPGEQWSFAATDSAGRVVRVAEKQRISANASTGLYYFSHVGTFLQTADQMIARGEMTRGEYYVIPVYQKYIDRGDLITLSSAREVWDMGTPAAKRAFERHLRDIDD